jgi:hypothetical protein
MLGRAAARGGRRRQAAIVLAALAAWMIAQSASGLAFQRYCEPIVLLGLAWLVAISDSGLRLRRWWLGPLALAAAQLGLSGFTLYRAAWIAPPMP